MKFFDNYDYGRSANRELMAHLRSVSAIEVGETFTGQAWKIGEEYFTITSTEINLGYGREYELVQIQESDIVFWFEGE